MGVWEDLKSSDLKVTNYFYNPNIWPKEEYEKRQENLKKVVKGTGTDLVIGDYEPKEHQKAVTNDGSFPNRCPECYKLRLRATAEYAKKNNYDYFSTTLLVSPYQNHEAIIKIANQISKELGIEFYYVDWRTDYRRGQQRAKDLGIYRQKYCGCQPSSEYR